MQKNFLSYLDNLFLVLAHEDPIGSNDVLLVGLCNFEFLGDIVGLSAEYDVRYFRAVGMPELATQQSRNFVKLRLKGRKLFRDVENYSWK